jgi:hypothetical protein
MRKRRRARALSSKPSATIAYGLGWGLTPAGTSGQADVAVLQFTPLPPSPPLPFGWGLLPAGTSG